MLKRSSFIVLVIAAAAALLSTQIRAQRPALQSPLDFLRGAVTDDFTVVAEESGDLNGDGLEDWAGIIEKRRGKDDTMDRSLQLFVLLRNPAGTLRLSTNTHAQDVSHPDCCELSITRSGLYIKTYSGNYSSAAGAATHQFKLYQGRWRLIGFESGSLGGAGKYKDISVNYLTGYQMSTEGTVDGEKHASRDKKAFPKYFLDDYDFEISFGL